MKRIHVVTAVCALAFGLMFAGATWASPHQGRHVHKAGFHHSRGNDGLMLLGRYISKNMMVHVLSEMTGQSVEAVDQQLREGHLRAVLDAHKIDRKAFRAAMRAKTEGLINQLADNGFINQKQKARIIEKMQARAERRALMTKLIQKGIADGTITPEESRLLKVR